MMRRLRDARLSLLRATLVSRATVAELPCTEFPKVQQIIRIAGSNWGRSAPTLNPKPLLGYLGKRNPAQKPYSKPLMKSLRSIRMRLAPGGSNIFGRAGGGRGG